MAGGVKAVRGEAVRSSHAVVGSGRGRPDLIKLLLEQEESWVTERPDPLRADAGLARARSTRGAALIMAPDWQRLHDRGHRATLR